MTESRIEGIYEYADIIAIPTKCPSCGGPVRRDGDFIYCAKPEECRDVRIAGIVHYCHIVGMRGFGKEVVAKAYDAGLLRTPVELYTLIEALLNKALRRAT